MRGRLPITTDLNCYVDASHAADIDTRRSTTGYIFFMSGGPVSWQSRMQTTVALFSMEAEYMAASAATQEALWQARLLQQLGMRIELPIILYEDNKSATLVIIELPNISTQRLVSLKKHKQMVTLS